MKSGSILRASPGFQTALVIMVVLPASAHPGHDSTTYGASHFVTSPYHLATLAAVAIALWCAARFIQHRFARRFLEIGAAATMGCVAILWLAGV